MMIFLYGEDTYRMKEKLTEIIERYKKTGREHLSLKRFDFAKENLLKEIEDELKQFSMFKEKKLLVIANPFSNKQFKEEFKKRGSKIVDSEDVAVFYQEGSIAKNDVFLKFLEKNAKCQKFDFLVGSKLILWIRKMGLKSDEAAENLLIQFVGSDLWRMNQEIKKLISFRNGKTVTADDVKLLIKPNFETDIFKTVDQIAQKNKKEALKLIRAHIDRGESPLYLFAMINYQFRNLLLLKDLATKSFPYEKMPKKLNLHPFVVKKTFYQSQKFSLTELKKIYSKIFRADVEIKTGKINPEAGLELFLAEI